jgi:hypothetical protein
MPGCRLEHVTNLACCEISHLDLIKFALQNKHTNIIAVAPPHRHDLLDFSCVNKETQVFNRKLRKLLKDMNHTSVVDTNLTRDKFTHHGLHMNLSGREMIAKIIGQTITTPSTGGTPTISLKWEEVPLVTSNVETKIESTSMNDVGTHVIVARSSSRPKKPPMTRNEVFYGWYALQNQCSGL